MYLYKEDLALNNLKWLMCHKTKPLFIRIVISVSFSLVKAFLKLFFDLLWCVVEFLLMLS